MWKVFGVRLEVAPRIGSLSQLAELFDTSVPNISMHISNLLNYKELDANSVVKKFFTTAADAKPKAFKLTLKGSNVNSPRCNRG